MVSEEMTDWGISMKTVEVQDIQPSPSMQQAMEQQAAAERERKATVTRAEGAKQAAILEADGRLESAKRDAEAEVTLADASKKAILLVKETTEDSALPLTFLLGQRYIDAIKDMSVSPNSKFVVLPADIQEAVRGTLGRVTGPERLIVDFPQTAQSVARLADALLRRRLVPFLGLLQVPRQPLTLLIEPPQIKLCKTEVLARRAPKPFRGLHAVLGDAVAELIGDPQIVLRQNMPLLRRQSGTISPPPSCPSQRRGLRHARHPSCIAPARNPAQRNGGTISRQNSGLSKKSSVLSCQAAKAYCAGA